MSSHLIKLDLHAHPLPKLGFLEKLIDHCINTEMNVVAITDVKDERYDQLREYTRYLSSLKYKTYLTERGFITIKRGGGFVKFIRGQEVFTREGHILTVGAIARIQDNQLLETTLKQAEDYDAIIIADHPYVPQSVWGGIGEENLIKNRERLQAIEWNAQCINLFPFPKYLMQAQANEKAEEFSKKYNLPLVADSDAHFTGFGSLKQIGLAYIQLSDFEYKGDEQFITHLRKTIKENQYTNIKKTISRLGFLRWCIPLYIKKLSSGTNGHNPKTN